MPVVNGENIPLVLDETVIYNVMSDVPIPDDPHKIGSWRDYGRTVATQLRRLTHGRDVTLEELYRLGQHWIPVKLADAWMREATKNGLSVKSRGTSRTSPAVVGNSFLWTEIVRRHLRLYLDWRDHEGEEYLSVLSLQGAITRAAAIRTDRALVRDILRARRDRLMAEEAAPPEPTKSRMERQSDMARHIREHRSNSLTPTYDPLSTLEIQPNGTRASRTWGIEVEHPAAFGVHAPDGWREVGDGSLYSEDADHDYECALRGEDDVSCDCGLDYDASCKEFVSPVLTSVHSRGLQSIMAALSDRPYNESAGIHVHVAARNPDGKALTPRQVASLVYGYNLLEPLWEDEYNREESARNEYSQSYTPDWVFEVASRAKTMDRNADTRDVVRSSAQMRGPGRYYNVNLQSLGRHGTIEFRAMGPNYDYRHLIRWAMFCREMVNVAQSGFNRWDKVRSFKDLRKVFARYGSETADAPILSPEALLSVQADRELVAAGEN